MKQKTIFLQITYLFLFMLCAGQIIWSQSAVPNNSEPKVLRFFYASGENPSILYEKFSPLIAIISESIGIPVEFYQTYSYRETQEVVHNGTVHMGILNALSYIKIRDDTNILPIAARIKDGQKDYRTYIITKKESDILNYEDFKDKIFAMGDPYSTSSSFMPKIMLTANGIDPDIDLYQIRNFTKQDSILYSLLNKTADVGAIASFIFNEYDPAVTSRLKILYRSDPFPLGPFVVQQSIGNELIEKIKNTLLSLHTGEEGRYVLEIAELERFGETSAQEYDELAELFKLNPLVNY